MHTQEIVQYINEQRRLGVDSESIKRALFKAGWPVSDVEEAFKILNFPHLVPRASKKRKLVKVISVTVLIIVGLPVLFVVLPAVFGLFSKDIGPIDDSDLQLKKIEIPQQENAYYDLIKIKNVDVPKDMDVFLSGKVWDEQIIKDSLAKNTQNLQYFSDASQKPKFQDPDSDSPEKVSYDLNIMPMSGVRRASQSVLLRAHYLARQGKDKEAIGEAVKVIQTGQKLQDSQSVLITYLVARAMKDNGLEALQRILIQSKLSSETLIQYGKDLEQYKENKEGLKTVFKGEYTRQSKATDSIISEMNSGDQMKSTTDNKEPITVYNNGSDYFSFYQKPGKNFYFQPNKTKSLFADYNRWVIQAAEKPCGMIGAPELQISTQNSTLRIVKLYFTPNAVGKVLHDIVAASLSSVLEKKCQQDFLVSSTQLLFAMKAYKNDTAKLPNTLQDLVPKYITSIPEDPFNGKTIKYSPEKKLIYSVGKDIIDSGGNESDEWRNAPDPSFKIEF